MGVSKFLKDLSKRQEKQAAKDVGGYTTAGSGNARLGGGRDVRKRGVLSMECKVTTKPFYSIKLAELEKIGTCALLGGDTDFVFQFAFKEKHTGRLDKYAIVYHPPGPAVREDARSTIIAHTKAKSITVGQMELKVKFLEYNELSIGFDGCDGGTRFYDIMRWDRFMEGRGEEC